MLSNQCFPQTSELNYENAAQLGEEVGADVGEEAGVGVGREVGVGLGVKNKKGEIVKVINYPVQMILAAFPVSKVQVLCILCLECLVPSKVQSELFSPLTRPVIQRFQVLFSGRKSEEAADLCPDFKFHPVTT